MKWRKFPKKITIATVPVNITVLIFNSYTFHTSPVKWMLVVSSAFCAISLVIGAISLSSNHAHDRH